MSTTPIASAHVCTPKSEPQYVFSSGAADFLNTDRRFFVVDAENLPPEDWVGNIVPWTPCRDEDAKCWNDPLRADFYAYVDAYGRTQHNAQRHAHGYPSTPSLWNVTVRRVANGRRWELRLKAVTDDFGWLVEVPAP